MKRCVKLSMKVVNSTIGLVGIAMIIYGVWMIRVWQRDAAHDDDYDSNNHFPWFIHGVLVMGMSLCGIACLGHVAAHTANNCCLSSYMFFILLLLLSETAFIADVLLNSEWEKDLPDDPSGRFDDFRDFVNSNIDICQWIALFILLAQGCSVLLATVLRTLGTNKGMIFESSQDDEEYDELPHTQRFPLLSRQPTYVVGEPHFIYSDPAWEFNNEVRLV